jgi:hypothetical protein
MGWFFHSDNGMRASLVSNARIELLGEDALLI